MRNNALKFTDASGLFSTVGCSKEDLPDINKGLVLALGGMGKCTAEGCSVPFNARVVTSLLVSRIVCSTGTEGLSNRVILKKDACGATSGLGRADQDYWKVLDGYRDFVARRAGGGSVPISVPHAMDANDRKGKVTAEWYELVRRQFEKSPGPYDAWTLDILIHMDRSRNRACEWPAKGCVARVLAHEAMHLSGLDDHDEANRIAR